MKALTFFSLKEMHKGVIELSVCLNKEKEKKFSLKPRKLQQL